MQISLEQVFNIEGKEENFDYSFTPDYSLSDDFTLSSPVKFKGTVKNTAGIDRKSTRLNSSHWS